jgi:hypothetical protein
LALSRALVKAWVRFLAWEENIAVEGVGKKSFIKEKYISWEGFIIAKNKQ